MEPSVWLIAGPTASGKSALALRLAEALGAELVNADSMQLYADLAVLTARPSPDDLRRAPHHLYGVADAKDAWSVGRWLATARTALEEISARRRPAVVVGGTGLYFRALTEGLADMPAIPLDIRDQAERRFDTEGEQTFREVLAARDPVSAARIQPGDRQRLVRAWSVIEASGVSLPAWQATSRQGGAQTGLASGTWRAAVLDPSRQALYARCDARLLAMVQAGALGEVAALMARGLSASLPAMRALGAREFAAALDGRYSLDEAIATAQLHTRRYAKRQSTWFRNQTPDWPRIAGDDHEAQWLALEPLAASSSA